MPTSDVGINQQDIPRFTCKTSQIKFYRKKELMHNKKCEHLSNIACKYFLTNRAEEAATREDYVGSEMTNSLCLLPM